jgi:hypothetical protein
MSLDLSQSYGLPRPVTGIALPLPYSCVNRRVSILTHKVLEKVKLSLKQAMEGHGVVRRWGSHIF